MFDFTGKDAILGYIVGLIYFLSLIFKINTDFKIVHMLLLLTFILSFGVYMLSLLSNIKKENNNIKFDISNNKIDKNKAIKHINIQQKKYLLIDSKLDIDDNHILIHFSKIKEIAISDKCFKFFTKISYSAFILAGIFLFYTYIQ